MNAVPQAELMISDVGFLQNADPDYCTHLRKSISDSFRLSGNSKYSGET